MEPYQERVVEEQKEVQSFLAKLKERRDKLADFVESQEFSNISENQQSLLGAQLVEMSNMLIPGGSYESILLSRIADFNGKTLTVAAG